MRFDIDDLDFEDAVDGLASEYGRWLEARPAFEGDSEDAGQAMRWKVEESDGDLATWTVAHLDEFLLGWCPRAVPMRPKMFARFPISIGAFCAFLADRDLLSDRSDRPEVLQRHCEQVGPAFTSAMADPGNWGPRKQRHERDLETMTAQLRAAMRAAGEPGSS